MAKPLAQVTDVEALDAHEGTCASLAITVPAGWVGATVEVTVPRLLACFRCGGGGCDRCGRSGALRAPDERLTLSLPRELRASCIRLPAPFADGAIEQLMVEVRVDVSPSAGVRRIDRPAMLAPAATGPHPAVAIGLVLLLAAILGVLLTL